MNNFGYLRSQVVEWAESKGIFKNISSEQQCLKFMSEAGELCDAVLKNSNVKEEMGDCIITMLVLCKILNLDMLGCLKMSLDKINGRDWLKNENGVLLKEVVK